MKKLILTIICGYSLQLYAQKADTTQLITAFGKPDGTETSIKIGKEGGKLSSFDGKVELIIPPGALSKSTTIRMQPVKNMLAAGGRSYHLQPADIKFSQPLEIIFHYTNDENGSDPQTRGIAMQDEEGRWHHLSNAVVDSVNKTVSGKINHFSYWVDYERVSITPERARVRVNKEIALQLNLYIPSPGVDDGSGDVLPPLPPMSLVTVNLPPVWTANAVVNGNTVVGTISTSGDISTVRYKAPASVPNQNPVAVTAELKNLRFSVGNNTLTNLKVTTPVYVYDDKTFEVKLTAWNDQTSLPCGERAEDEGGFLVQLHNNTPNVMDIQNSLMTIPKRSGCKCAQVWINQGITVGTFHITGVQSIYVTPAAPPQKPHAHIRILFRPAYSVYPVYLCPGDGGANAAGLPPIPAMPKVIEFDAKDEEQVLFEMQDNMTGMKMIVRPLREE
jgi:hypothetical protein